MKTIKSYLFAILFALPIFATTSCYVKDKEKNEEENKPESKVYYDLWVSIGETSGMGTNSARLVKSVENPEKPQNIDFKGSGADVSSKLFLGSIIKGGYYYQVPRDKDRIGKYKIENGIVETVAEVKFQNNTLQDRKYTHAWINDNTFVLFGADGKAQKILWIKVDAENMKIISEGTLDIEAPSGKYKKLSTSGIANFRKSDGKILYAYLYKTKGKVHREDHFLVAFINPETMAIEKTIKEERAEFMAGTAFGELNQNKTFFNENGDYYIACNSVLSDATKHTHQRGNIVCIKNGTTEFDKSYLGFNNRKGKIVTVDYLKNEKALLYIEDPEHSGSDWSSKSFNCYYAVLDLKNDKLTEIKLPFSQGVFSQRSVVVGNKAYIGINPKETQPAIYVYDITSGKLTKGLTITEGYSFDRLVKIEK